MSGPFLNPAGCAISASRELHCTFEPDGYAYLLRQLHAEQHEVIIAAEELREGKDKKTYGNFRVRYARTERDYLASLAAEDTITRSFRALSNQDLSRLVQYEDSRTSFPLR